MDIVLLAIAVLMGVACFRLLQTSFDIHWSLCLLFGLLPVVATFFLGIFGLLLGGLLTGAMFKASS